MSEKEYIERGEVKEKLSAMRQAMVRIYGSGIGNLSASAVDAMKANINAIPAADVEPVARGEWKESFTTHDCQYAPNGVRYIFWYTCSNCGKKSRTKHARCLKCFAHMERSGSGE